MTEHSKIPVPSGDAAGNGGSLIERAVRTFDLGKLAPPPVPGNLAPPLVKPAQRHRAPVARSDEEEREPLAPTSRPLPRLPRIEPESAPIPVRDAQAQARPVETAGKADVAVFTGPRHPVDRERLVEQGMIVPEGAVTATLEEFRIVKRQLLLNAAELHRQGNGPASLRILVCSPHSDEGKTWCSVNLALSIAAERETEVVLVDGDFAKPSVLSALGLPGGPGLMDALTDPDADVADFVIGTDIPGLWVLPSGSTTHADSEYLRSSHTAAVLDRLTQGAPNRIVIFDTPPVLAASPAAELAKYVGQAVMVVRAERTGQGALDDAISLLSGCPNIQLLLNAVSFSPSGRRFGTYYGYSE